MNKHIPMPLQACTNFGVKSVINFIRPFIQLFGAYNIGQVQEVERLYATILQAPPKHPSDDHNMGVSAGGVSQAQNVITIF
jgi:hypothetical protein